MFFRKIKKPLFFDLVLILVLGLLSLTWFRGNYLISGGDFGMPFDRLKYLQLMFSTWEETYSLGAPDYRQIASLIPYALWGGATEVLGLSLVFWEKSLFYIWFAGGGLSMYYLCSVLGMGRVGKLAASIFYMLNPFSLIIIWRVSHALIQMPYAFAPLYLGLFINGLQKKKGVKYIFWVVFLWLMTTTSAYAWPTMAIVHWIPIFLYFLVSLIFQPGQRRFILKYTFVFFGVWLIFNFYWLFPFVVSISESVASAHSPVLLSDIETLRLTSVKLADAIRMLGFWSLHNGYKGEPYYPYEALYLLPSILLISWLIPLLVFTGFFHKDIHKHKLILFFIVTLIFGLFGIKGPHFPLGELAIWIYQTFPNVGLLTRFTFLFFGIPTYMIFSVLLGFGFLVIRDWGIARIKKLIYLPLAFLSILLFVVLVWPFWTGEVIRSEGKLWSGERVDVPSYWWEAKKWLSEQKDFFRILPLPMAKTYNVAFDWSKGYSGGDITRWFTSQPVLNVNTGWTFEIPELIGNLIEKETDFRQAGKIMGFLNVKYLLVREDTRWEFTRGHEWWFAHNLENIQKFIGLQKDLKLEKEFGKLKFYSIKSDNLLPRVYVSNKIVSVRGETTGLTDIASFLNPDRREGIIFIDQNLGKTEQFRDQFSEFFIWQEPVPLAEEQKTLVIREAVGEEKIDASRATYGIKVDKSGDYEIFLRDDDFLKYYLPAKNLISFKIDDFTFERSAKIIEDNLISLGEVSLNNGLHNLTILTPPARNLADDPSFEKGLWSGAIDVSKSPSTEISAEQVSDAIDGKYALKLANTEGNAAVFAPIQDFNPQETYKVSLAAKHLWGKPPRIVFWENYTKSSTPTWRVDRSQWGTAEPQTKFSASAELSTDSSWRGYEFIFRPKNTTQVAGLVFFADRAESGGTANLYDDVKIERVLTNPVLLKYLPPELSTRKTPQVSFNKISTTKYEVQVSDATDPYFLIFSESFHPGWKASVEGEHLVMNGFANSWYITKPGNYKMTIEFTPQRIYYLGVGVSLAAFIILLVLILTRRVR